MKSFAIVGAGHAGLSAALELRRLGVDGRVLLLGAEPHLPYERPPLSKAQLRADGVLPTFLRSAAALAAQNIDVRTGSNVEAIDLSAARLRLSDGSSLAYDELLLATGGRARMLDGLPGGEHSLNLRSHDDALALRRRLAGPQGTVAVIGAGVIGLEVAVTARGLGWKVCVLERADRPMARSLTPDLSRFVAAVHAAAGVDLRCRATVHALERRAGGRISTVTDRGSVTADLVVAGIGMAPDTRLAVAAGIDTSDAILVDEFGRSSAPHVHAAGDVASLWHPRLQRRLRFENWQHAGRHGAAAARTMCGVGVSYDELPWSWTDQFDVNLQIIGLPADGDLTLLRGSPADRRFVALHLLKRRLVGATLVNAGRELRPCKALIESGVQLDVEQLAAPTVSLREYAAESAALA